VEVGQIAGHELELLAGCYRQFFPRIPFLLFIYLLLVNNYCIELSQGNSLLVERRGLIL